MDIQKLRHDFRLSQKALGTILGCQQSNVCLIEKGERDLTQLQVRLLIEKFGFDVVAQYASPGEMPQGAVVTVNAPVITDNTAPVQAGNNNSMEMPNDTAALVALMHKMLDQHEKQLQKRDEQIDRLIDILEKK